MSTWRPDSGVHLLDFVSVLCNPCHHRSNKDLNELPVEERSRVFEDLAGTSQLPREDVHELAGAIQRMQVEIGQLSQKSAYDLALGRDPRYVMDPGFLLMFLRANDYKVAESAKQVVAHFEEKLSLFGEEKLTKNIQLSDLSPDDLEAVRSGGLQVSNCKDAHGRNIFFFRASEFRYKERMNWHRSTWYIMMAALEDENVQRKGVVSVAYEVGDESPNFDFELLRRELQKMKCIPIRPVAGHFCTSANQTMNALDLIIHMSIPFFRVRLRFHYGIETEVLYQLMAFGIPLTSVPWIGGGDDTHKNWLQERERLESGEYTPVYMEQDDYFF